MDVSWMFMAGLIVWALWSRESQSGRSDRAALGLAIFSAVLFFFSILLHEGAHAAMCKARGIEVESITLFALGGYTSAQIDRKSAMEEFLVAFVGPLTSFALGLLMIGAGHGIPDGDISRILTWTGTLNIALAAFNILPAFPLDGGRVLKAAVMGASGNRHLAANVAGWTGQIAGAGMMAFGVLTTAGAIRSAWGGPFMVFIGLIVIQGARGGTRREALLDLLEGATVADAMSAHPVAIPPQITLSQALDLYLRANPQVTFPVAEGDRPLGVLNLAAASEVGQHDPMKLVVQAMVPLSAARTVTADTPLERATELASKGSLLVLDGERLVGALNIDDIARFATSKQEGADHPMGLPPRPVPDESSIPPRPDV